MRLIFLLFALLISINVSNAQETIELSESTLRSVMDQVDLKAKKLCQYIIDIGSSKTLMTNDQKSRIINDEIPFLFWKYDERLMTTSSGYKGSVVRQQYIWQYFIKLHRQSIKPFNKEVKYELMYDKVYSDSKIKDLESWEMCEEYDNCKVWRQTIRFSQTYYVIDHNVNFSAEIKTASRVVTKEVDNKYLYIYIIQRKDDNTVLSKIGDVYMVERVN